MLGTVPRQYFVGFDHLFELLDKQPWKTETRSYDPYPPHNVITIDENTHILEFALAGFTPEDVTIDVLDSELKVCGEKKDDRQYAYKGISSKNFSKTFTLADFVTVTGAEMKDGILLVHLKRELPEAKKSRRIAIGKPELLQEG